MDELKRYFQQHREQLDQDEPGAGLWEKIASGLPDKPVQQTGGILSLMIRRVAAACILVLAGIGTWYILTDHTQTQKNRNSSRPAQNNTYNTPGAGKNKSRQQRRAATYTT